MSKQETIPHDVLDDLRSVAEALDCSRSPDRDLVRRVQDRANKAREELVKALGVQDIGVELIREARDAR